MNKADFVNQKALAVALGVTDRRVRQMVDEKLLPEPGADSVYDLARCQERYDLYQARDDVDAWERFLSSIERRSGQVELLVSKALKPDAGWAPLREASLAVQAIYSDLQFCNAAKGKSEAERTFVAETFRSQEDQILGPLVMRGFELAKMQGLPRAIAGSIPTAEGGSGL